MPRVAIQLELEWSYKRHAAIFSGAQKYAQEKGWESIIDEPFPNRCCVGEANRSVTTASSHGRGSPWPKLQYGSASPW